MPKERLPPVDTCETHSDEKINYYCKEHSSLACQKCAFLKHRACRDVSDISELSTDLEIVQRFQEMMKKIQDLESKTEQNRQTSLQNLSKIDSNKKQAKADIKTFCAAMHERLYKLERKADEEVDRLEEASHKCMNKIQQDCDSVSSDLKILKTMLETSQDHSQKNVSFIVIEKAKTVTEILKDRLTTLSRDNTVKEYKFNPNDQLKGLITDVQTIGELSVNNMTDILSLQTLMVKVKPAWNMDTVTAVEEDGINVRTQMDKGPCRITGTTIIEGGTTLAVADKNNCSTKLVDIKQNNVIFQLRLPDWPWDITQVQHDQLAVTLPAAHKIQFLSVTMGTSLSLGRRLNVSGVCRGIAYNNDRLFVSFEDHGQVQILSMSGNVLKTISLETDGQIMFAHPYYLTLNEDRSLLYVSGSDSNTVYCLDMNGAVKVTYSDQGLKGPYGLCVAEGGSLIVCGGCSCNVYVISSDCSRGRILLNKSRGSKCPDTVTYSSALSTLYAAVLNSDRVKVFKLK